jgi:hypothetical protein
MKVSLSELWPFIFYLFTPLVVADDSLVVNAQWSVESPEQLSVATNPVLMTSSLRNNIKTVYEMAGLQPDLPVDLNVIPRYAGAPLAPPTTPPSNGQLSTPRPALDSSTTQGNDNTALLVTAGVLGGISLVCVCGWLSCWWARAYKNAPPVKECVGSPPAAIPVRIERPPPCAPPVYAQPQQFQPPPQQQCPIPPQQYPAFALPQQQPQQPAVFFPVGPPAPPAAPAPAVYFAEPSAPPLPVAGWQTGSDVGRGVVFKIPECMRVRTRCNSA